MVDSCALSPKREGCRLAGASFALFVLVAGCGDSNPYTSLYGAPVGPVTSTIHGRWATSDTGLEVRWVLAPDQVTFANKCGDRIVGLDIAAEVTDTLIRILEGGQAGDDDCYIRSAGASDTLACNPSQTSGCFRIIGTSLTIYGTGVDSVTFTKLSDSTDF